MGSYNFANPDKFGKKWLALFWPLVLAFGSFLALFWTIFDPLAKCRSGNTAPGMSTDRTGSDWIRTEANFGRIRTGSDCSYF